MYHVLRRFRSLTLVATFLLLMVVLFSSWSHLSAQTDDPEQPDPSDPTLTEAMRRFLENREPVLEVPEAMGATPCVGGMAGPYPCENVDLMAFIPYTTFNASYTNDIWGWTDPLDGKEYAMIGVSNGTAFVDVTDPVNPVYLGKLPTQTSSSPWRDIKVYNNYAFVVSEASGHGMQIFDLTELRSVASPPVTFSNTDHYNGFGRAHNVVINEDSGYAYGVGTSTCSGGLHMVNIQDPLNAINAGCYSSDGYTHDAQCVNYTGPDPDYAGAEVCFNSNEDTLTIVDVTNKAAPALISRTSYPGVDYTHQGWVMSDHRYFLLGDEGDEISNGHNTRTYIWDLLDLDNPQLLGNYTGPNPSIDHNMYVVGNYVYQSNYTSGLQILDLSDIANTNLQMVAYFDTYTPHNNPNFNGSWSNYPYFDSGIVVVTGIDEGLFILSPSLAPDFQMSANSSILSICGDGSDMLTLDLTPRNGYTGTVTLSASGLPAGATPGFSPNPVMPPATSDLTVTTSGVAVGDYPFTIMGSDLPLTHTVNATLHINDAVPGLPVLTTPADGAIDVEILPALSWTAATQGTSYYVEIATDMAFNTIVYSATASTTSHQVTDPLEPETTYYWHVRADNICGNGIFSAAFSFTTMPIPPILLVDDDDNSPDVRSYYTDALDALFLDYDIWDTNNSDNEPTFGLLAPYSTIIWFTGDEFGGFAGPSSSTESDLGAWLDNGNCFFISSQDYHYDRNLTPFMITYLGVSSVVDDSGNYSSVVGQGSVFGSIGSLSLSYPFSDFSDIVSHDGTAELAFDGNNGNDAAVDKDSGTYRSVFFGFPFEAISGAGNRQTVMDTIVNWCGLQSAVGTLAGQVTDASGGQGVEGALITADNGTGSQSTTTDNNGDYDLPLPVGTYEVTVSAAGYLSQTVTNVDIFSNTTTIQDFSLVAAVGTLERDRDEIEETLLVGESVTNTLVVSNTGTVPFDFTTNESAPWAAVIPDNGTLNPGQAMTLFVVFDSTATAGAGTYSDTLSFSGTFDNSPGDVDLILHVQDAAYYAFVPVLISDGGGANQAGSTGVGMFWMVPLVGIVAVAGTAVRKRIRESLNSN